eukprot:SAG22_NODE_133_length_18379_cov_34.571937_7_plen_130_part_00
MCSVPLLPSADKYNLVSVIVQTLPRYFREAGYITAGGGKLFHPDGCNMWPDNSTGAGNLYMHPAPMFWPPQGNVSNFSHTQGDDSLAWTLPYFPHTDTIVGNNSDCVQFGVEPCNGPGEEARSVLRAYI